jgi:hypothetical protein
MGGLTMPVHDWSRVPAGIFHDFHQSWSIRIKDALNAGLLPKGTLALVEQRAGPFESDVLAIELGSGSVSLPPDHNGGVATLAPPKTRVVQRSEKSLYAERSNRIVVKHHLGRTIAVIELVSPGNKDRKFALREFVEKTLGFIRSGIHVLVVDLFPPSPRDPLGVHKLIWDEVEEAAFTLPPGKDRILAAYEASRAPNAYVEMVGVGDPLPDMPLFLATRWHIDVPLESSYQATWQASPVEFQNVVETGVMPGVEISE